MRFLFKQRFLSWFDSFDIYDKHGNVAFTIEGELSFGHCFRVYDKYRKEIGMVKQEVFTLLPEFTLFKNNVEVGNIKKKFSFFTNDYEINFNGWYVEGDFTGWDYRIYDSFNNLIITISKDLFHLTDQYEIDVKDEKYIEDAIIFVAAIDAEKCSSQ